MLFRILPLNWRLCFILSFPILVFTPLFAQSQTELTVISSNSGKPILSATIEDVEEKRVRWITDKTGKAVVEISKSTPIRVASVGFVSQELVANPGIPVTIRLQEDVFGLDDVVVTGAFTPTTSSQSLYKVRTIDAAIIEARGAVNLADVLQTQLNLKIIQDDVLGSRVVMQGISGPNVKILVDGVPMVNGSGGNFDLTQFNMNNVERVEIVEGPLSVQYGTNALAGTINIITKNYGPEEQALNMSTYYESVGQYNADARWAKGWKNLSISVGGARNQFNGYSSNDERNKDWIPRTQYLTDAKIKYQLGSFAFTGAYDQLWENSISYGEPTSAFNNKTNKLSLIANDIYFKTGRINGSLITNGTIGTNHYLNLVNGVSFYSQGKKKYLQDVNDDMKWLSTVESEHDTTSFKTFTSRGTYVMGDNQSHQGGYWTVGYEVSINTADGGMINSQSVVNVNDLGLFTAIELPVGQKMTFQPAIRFAYSNKYDAKEIDFLSTGLPILPSINLKYNLKPNLDFRFSYGQGYRTPSVRELYYEFINSNHYIVGNPDLIPEIGKNFNFSSTWNTQIGSSISASIRPSLFYSDISNKIELVRILDRETLPDDVPKMVPVARTYSNIPNFKSLGFNLGVDLAVENGIKLSPGVGVLSRSGSESDKQFYTSYEANLNASYFIKSLDMKINAFYKYNGSMSEFAKEEDGSIGILTLESYNTLDLSISRIFVSGKLFATLGAKNLFDINDVQLVGEGSKGLVSQTGNEAYYPISWGRSLFIKINYSIY
ncbi:TonB-dependent receptor [Algoriphagus aquimarinus]|uniref:TonB-dependent receptor n=1 Tax=Algoriphagus aquimarinus TaxID=237018 RepID=UPI0030D80B15|tara:strand:+ start:37309 stop:39633 length:2325 start_codon:yes stop_codon:yes gene_type:complete